MVKTDLIKFSQEVKKEADELLIKTDLIKFLSNYGKIFIWGSYKLDLMMSRDIDINIVDKDSSKEKTIDILNNLIRENKFRGYIFYDFVKRRKKGFPKGYYIGLKTRFKGNKWVIDIWFLKQTDQKSDKLLKSIKKKLNKEKKLKILELKHRCIKKKLEIRSHLIYKAVLENKKIL